MCVGRARCRIGGCRRGGGVSGAYGRLLRPVVVGVSGYSEEGRWEGNGLVSNHPG